MADLVRGKIIWQNTKTGRARRVVFPTKKGMSIPTPYALDQITGSLETRPEDEIEVDLELVNGKPTRIRPIGEQFAAQPASQSSQPQSRQPRGQHGRGQHRSQTQPHQAKQRPVVGAFHNPYNFVPALPRDQVTGELGDCEPLGHHILHADRYTGVIQVKLTVQTPLLLPDVAKVAERDECDGACVGGSQDLTVQTPLLLPNAAKVAERDNDPKSFPVRVDADGKPYIPPTSIKGTLRAAYEAVTNSRLAVFSGHEDRLADRMPARDGLTLVPARIVEEDGTEHVELLPGDSGIGDNGEPYLDRSIRPSQRDPMYAAWMPRYDRQSGQVAPFAIRYPNNQLPQHGDAVQAWLELWERTGDYPFRYWSVRKCVRANAKLGSAPAPGQRRGAHQPVPNVAMISVQGSVCITNRNIDRKHDERVFFTTRNEHVLRPLTDDLRRRWRELIANYQSIHEEERRSGMQSPPALNNSEWSRQVVGGEEERQLTSGTLCYAAFQDGNVTALYPVMISRRLFELSPASLLPESLCPATSLTQLSPADRVFGWVNQDGKGAYRGNLRISPVACRSDNAIERFGDPGLPLAILGQPKPQQARFYVAASPSGCAQRNGLSKDEAGYREGKGLRGRKVYPHHRGLSADHWRQPMTDRTQQVNGGHFQEYRRPHQVETETVQQGNRTVTRAAIESDGAFRLRSGDEHEQRDNQNRSIQGWVKPGVTFTFNLHVTNLSKVEIGALLWLLSLPANHFHRFGGGKPLGFGSVRLEISSSQLHAGNDWKQVYSTLDDFTPTEADHAALIDKYKQAVRTAYGSGGSFEKVPFIAAFLRMATGHADSLPIHYPRARQRGQADPVPPHPEGQAYEWFVANDRTGQNAGPQASLPDLATDSGLPMLDAP